MSPQPPGGLVLIACLSAACSGAEHPGSDADNIDASDEDERPWGPTEDTGDVGDDSDIDLEPGPGEEHAFTTYEGQETMWMAFAAEHPGDYACVMIWHAEGTPKSPMSTSCEGCTFAFEVDLRYDADASLTESSCTIYAGNMQQTYAYAPDYYADGVGAVLYQYFEYYYPRGEASFEDGVFTYGGGYLDYYYTGSNGYYEAYADTWFTNWRFGGAVVE